MGQAVSDMVAPHRTACVLRQCSDSVAASYSGSVPDGSVVGYVAYTHVPGPGAAQFVSRLTSSSNKLELTTLVGGGVAPLGSKWIVAYE